MDNRIKINDKNEVVVTTSVDLQLQKEARAGDVYRKKDNYYCDKLLVKLTRIKEGKYPTWMGYEFDFECGDWESEEKDLSIYPATINQGYIRFLGDPYEYARAAHDALGGDLSGFPEMGAGIEDTSEEGLVSKSVRSDALVEVVDKLDVLRNKSKEITYMAECMMKHQEMRLKKMVDKMNEVVGRFHNQIRKIMKVISMIELYLGVNEELYQICEGEVADADEPLTLRQLVLYMDEETALTGYKYEGYDFRDIGKFDEWLTDPAHRDLVIPEKRSIVVFKPRRKDKHYTSDRWENQEMNKWNHLTYILLRNGDNLYRVYSENFFTGDVLFPRKEELKACLESDNEFKLESLQDRAVKFAMFINGIFDRSTIMHPINGKVDMFKMDESPIRIIYDAEPSLGDGRLSFREYVKEVNSTISEGSRIFLAKQPSREEKSDRLLKFYANEFNMPEAPGSGVYQVYANKHETYRFQQWKKKTGNEDAKQLCIKYKPGGSYYSNWNGDDMKRKNSVTWLIDVDHDEILNYDNVSFEEIDYYLQSRIHRSEYMYMFRALIGLRDRLRKEKEGEKDFIALLAGWSHSSIEKVEELVTWWKLKNKWKRSLSSDDAKAYRMILRKLKNEA